MKGLVQLALILVGFFLATFALAAATGWFDEVAVTAAIRRLNESPQGFWLISAAVIGLLAADLLLPVPGGPVMILAGHLLGPVAGSVVAGIGGILAGAIGYLLCRWGGQAIFQRFVNPDEADRVRRWLTRYGTLAILIGRALPIVPEVLACLAGLSRMRPLPFFTAFSVATIAFAVPQAVAGAYTTRANPWPGVLVGILIPTLGWVAWRLANRARHRRDVTPIGPPDDRKHIHGSGTGDAGPT